VTAPREHSPSKEELQADIERTRAELGQTVGALSERLDLKARAKNKAKSIPRAVPIAIVAAAAVGVGVLVWVRRS
jgi:hypothetical protein